MSFNGSGTFLRINNWTADATAKIKIQADRHDAQDNDFAAGLSNVICKDGQSQPTNDLPMNGHKLTNLGAPTNDSDAATKKYADTPKPYATGVEISGADSNGLLNFSSLTGANGLSFKGADFAWIARLATAAGPGGTPPATLNRLVLNNKPDGSGSDVITVNDDGSIVTTGAITGNTSLSIGTTIVAGGTVTATSQLIAKAASGNVHCWLKGPADENRAIFYTAAASMGHAYIQVNGTQNYAFQNNGVFQAPATVMAGNAQLQTNGNVVGSIWANFSGGSTDAYTATYNQIEARSLAWANDRVSNLQFRRGGQLNSGGSTNFESPAGCCVTGYQRETGTTGQVYWVYYRQMQFYNPANGSWINFHD